MDESSLTRMAVEEIVREMQEARNRELEPPIERKVNPLGKPNKRFLGRTINSILIHNKRENDRKHANCRQKLKELNDRARRRARYDYHSSEKKNKYKERNERSGSGRSNEKYISSSSDDKESSRKRKKKKKLKLKKHSHSHSKIHSRSKGRSRSKSRSHSKSRSRSKSSSSLSFRKCDDSGSQVANNLDNFPNITFGSSASDFYQQVSMHQYTNMAAAAAAAAYNQMSHVYSTMLRAATSSYPIEMTKTTLEGRTSASSPTSGLSISLSDRSLPSISDSLSSLEVDDNSVLTINVSSEASESEDEKTQKHRKHEECELPTDSDVEMCLSSNNEEPLLISVDSDSRDSSSADSIDSVVIVQCASDSAEESNASSCAGGKQSKCVADVTVEEVDLTEE